LGSALNALGTTNSKGGQKAGKPKSATAAKDMGCSSSKEAKSPAVDDRGSGGGGKTKAPKLGRFNSSSEDDEEPLSLFVIDTNSTISNGKDAPPDSQVYQKPESVREIIRTALKRNFIFQTMEPSALERLIDVFKPVHCRLGENIIEQGTTGEFMYAIEEGTFDVLKDSVGKIAEMKPGQTFGELALLYGAQRSATVLCTKAASLWALDRSTFRYYQTSNERRMKDMAVDVLKQVPLLKDLDPDQLQKVADVATTTDYREGDSIIRKGEIGNTFFIVLEGVVVCTDASMGDKGDESDSAAAVLAASADGGQSSKIPRGDASPTKLPEESAANSSGQTSAPVGSPAKAAHSDKAKRTKGQSARQNTADMLEPKSSSKEVSGGIRLKAGDWFGEIALLTGSARTANVMADSSVRLLAFDRSAFEKVLGSLRDLLDKKANMRMLTAVPIIAQLPERERNAAFKMFDTEEFPAGSLVVLEGTIGTKFYLVRSGTGVVSRKRIAGGGEEATAAVPPLAPSAPGRPTSAGARGGKGEKPAASGGGAAAATALNSGGQQKPSGGQRPGLRGNTSPEGSDADSFESLSSFDMAAASNQAKVERGKSSGASGKPVAHLPTILDVNPLLSEQDVLGEIKMGDHFGEESLSNDIPRFATVTAQTDMSCFVLERADFEAILHEYEQATQMSAHTTSREQVGLSLSTTAGSSNDGTVSGEPKGSALGVDAAGHEAKKRPPASHRGSYMSGEKVSPTAKAGAKDSDGSASAAEVDADAGGKRQGSGGSASEPAGPPPSEPAKAVELEVDWGALKNLGKIGAGTFGTVLMMQDTRDNSVFAMKVLDRKRVKKMRQERRLETEKQLLRVMRSPFICRLMADTEDESAFYLLMEMVQGGELQRLIHPSDVVKRAKQQADVERGKLAGIPHQSAKFYAAAISLPLVYVHRRMVAFRDLKPENVMIDRFGYPKLIDFGLAKPLEQTGGKTYTLCGTPEYLAPEVILGTGHNQAVDWWALGVLLFEMVVGSSPFLEKGVDRRKQDHMVIFENIVDNRVSYPRDMEAGCRDLVKRLLAGKPVTRLGSGRRAHKEYEEHLWFAGAVDWGLLARRQLQPPWYPPLKNTTDQACFKKDK